MGRVPPVVPDMLKYIEASYELAASQRPPRSGATPPSGCRGRFGGHMGIGRCCADQFDSMTAHVRRIESLLSPTGLWDDGIPIRRLA